MQKFEELENYIDAAWKTQGALAQKLHVSKNTVSQWVNRKLKVSPEYRKALSELVPPFNGPYSEPEAAISLAELEAAEKRIIAAVHWGVEEIKRQLSIAIAEIKK